MMLHDYKNWIQNKAEEISREEHETEFEDLPKDIQERIYNQAIEAYKDAYADSIDVIYEAIRDKDLNREKTLTRANTEKEE